MHTLKEQARDIPVVHETDVCVVGGSCTGVFAAVRAARLGMRVALVEKQNCFGGAATAGLVNVWHGLHDTQGERPIIGGMTREMLDRLRKRGAVSSIGEPAKAFRLNTEELKVELDELVVGHGIVPFLHTFYAAPALDGDRLDAVIVENKSGRQAIRARCFVDATGDADLALDLGLPSHAPESLQPPTTCAKIQGFAALGEFDWQAAVRDHGQEFGLEPDWGWGGPIPGLADIAFRADTHVFGLDTTDAAQLSRAEIEGRRKVRAMMDLLRRYAPHGETLALVDLAATIGVRETRRMAGQYRLTGDDVLHGRRFADAIANGTYPVDTHHATGSGITFRYLDGTEKVIPERGMPGRWGRWRDPQPVDPTFYQIPFRCLVHDRAPNLIFAGRMIDADKVAFSAIRVMVNTNQTGEAAGVACALAIEQGCPLPRLDPAALRARLAAGGSIVLDP